MQIAMTLSRRNTASSAVVLAASVFSLATLLLPWPRAGATERNAFILGQALDESGLITHTAERCLDDALVVIEVIVGVVCARYCFDATGWPRLWPPSSELLNFSHPLP